MRIYKVFLIQLLGAFALSLGSCSTDTFDYGFGGKDSGDIYLTIASVNRDVSTKASVFDVKNFKVEVLNSSGVAIKSWAKYSDVPEKVRLNVGDYTLRASYGKSDVSGFGAEYFEGRTDFKVSAQQSQRISVTCKLANVKLAVLYGSNIAQDNEDYYVDVKSVKGDALRFVKSEIREGYVPAGNLVLTIYLTDNNGATRSYTPDPIPAAANDFITIKVDTKEITGNVGLDITINSETDDKNIDIELPSFMLPKGAPKVSFEGFDATSGELNFTEGVSTEAKVNIRADGAVRSCLIKVNSEQLTALGWPLEFDLANLDEPTKAILKRDGLKWFENMNGTVFAYVDFSGVWSKLIFKSGVSPRSAFSVEVADSFAQSSSEKNFSANVEAPVFFIEPIADCNMWPSSVDLVVDVTKGDPQRVSLEYKTATTDWETCSNVTKSVSGSKLTLTANGLSPATPYTLRARYNNHISAESSATTEALLTLPNSSMEAWTTSNGPQAGWPDKGPFWAHWDPWDTSTQTQGWNSINKKTVRDNDPKSYVSNTGTRRSGSPRSGSYCAELRTLGWGSGTTAASGTSIIKQVDPAQLYLGGYNSTTQAPDYGVDFVSRPSGFTFWCKYYPKGSDAGIARMVVENRDNGTVSVLADKQITISATSDWTQQRVDLNYTVRDKKATHMYIVFISGTNVNTGDLDKGSVSRGSEHVGSKFYVDDIEVVY